MEPIVGALITISVVIVIFGFLYFLWCKKNDPLQKEDFSFDDIYVKGT